MINNAHLSYVRGHSQQKSEPKSEKLVEDKLLNHYCYIALISQFFLDKFLEKQRYPETKTLLILW